MEVRAAVEVEAAVEVTAAVEVEVAVEVKPAGQGEVAQVGEAEAEAKVVREAGQARLVTHRVGVGQTLRQNDDSLGRKFKGREGLDAGLDMIGQISSN